MFRITPEQSFVAFNDNVLIENVKIKILVNNIEVIGVWKSLFGFKSDKMWILEHTTACELKDSDSINVMHCCEIKLCIKISYNIFVVHFNN